MNPEEILNPSSTVVIAVDKRAGYFDPSFVKARKRALPTDSAETLESIDTFIEQSRNASY